MANPNLSLILQFAGQYDPAVEAELQQLTAAIQQWANSLLGTGKWTDIPPSDLKFASDTGTWTVPVGLVTHFSYRLIGTELMIRFYIGLCAVTGPPNKLYVSIPLPFKAVAPKNGVNGYLHGLTGMSVNHCIILRDLDVYADGIAVINSDKTDLTLACETLAAGTISGTGFAGIVGQISCEVQTNQ